MDAIAIMASKPDLKIPITAPVSQYRESSIMHPAALYTLVELSDEELAQVQETCESETGVETTGAAVGFPPGTRTRFTGGSYTSCL